MTSSRTDGCRASSGLRQGRMRTSSPSDIRTSRIQNWWTATLRQRRVRRQTQGWRPARVLRDPRDENVRGHVRPGSLRSRRSHAHNPGERPPAGICGATSSAPASPWPPEFYGRSVGKLPGAQILAHAKTSACSRLSRRPSLRIAALCDARLRLHAKRQFCSNDRSGDHPSRRGAPVISAISSSQSQQYRWDFETGLEWKDYCDRITVRLGDHLRVRTRDDESIVFTRAGDGDAFRLSLRRDLRGSKRTHVHAVFSMSPY